MLNGTLARLPKNIRLGSIAARMTLAATLLLGPTIPTRSQAVDQRNFWFLNNTGRQVDSIYISPHESFIWGGDVLGEAALPDGIGTTIAFNPRIRTSCYYDFKLVFHNGGSQVYTQGRDLCAVHAVQFNYNTSEAF